MPLSAQQAFDWLMEDPETFLHQHLVRVYAGINWTGSAFLWFGDDGEDYTGTQSFTFTSSPDGHKDGISLTCLFFGVKVLKFGEEITTLQSLPPVPIEEGARLCLTRQLSACLIAMQPCVRGVGPYLAHVHPLEMDGRPGGMTGVGLNELADYENPRFSGSDVPTLTFGKGDYGNLRVSPIGVADAEGRWTMYMQLYDNIRDHPIQDVIPFRLYEPEPNMAVPDRWWSLQEPDPAQ